MNSVRAVRFMEFAILRNDNGIGVNGFGFYLFLSEPFPIFALFFTELLLFQFFHPRIW